MPLEVLRKLKILKGFIWNRRIKLYLAELYIKLGGKNEFHPLFDLDIDGLAGLDEKGISRYWNQISRLREMIHIKTL